MNDQQDKGKLIITKIRSHIISMLIDGKNRALAINACCADEAGQIGNICTARVANVAPNLNAAFVDCPGRITGYLKESEKSSVFFINAGRKLPFHPGDRILVQFSTDSIKGKNPSLTSEISLTGKYCILVSGKNGLSFSGKYDNPEERRELIRKYAGQAYADAGFIIRTNAMYTGSEDILKEMKRLYGEWQGIIRSASEKYSISNIYSAPAPYLQDIRDTYDNLYDSIITDDRDIYHECREYLERFQPEDLHKLKYHDNSLTPMHVLYNIDRQLYQALDTKVWLRSGAYILIEPTQALTAIDVNTGKYISNRDREDEFLKINQEAAAEIARQIRLRNLSGIIMIDFINMKKESSKKLLMEYLKSRLKFDPVKTNIIEMTKLDLVEITRSKIRKPIYEILDISMLQ